MTNDLTEKLVVQAEKGDKAAYTQLIRLHYKRVYLLCYGILGDEHHAEDVSQEVFIKGFAKLGSLRNPAYFDRWIGKIARHLAITFVKRRKKHQPLPKLVADNPVESNEQHERLQNLDDALQKLPSDLRIPLVMYYFDGRKVPAVAKTLGVSNSSVYLKLRTALVSLKELIQQGEAK